MDGKRIALVIGNSKYSDPIFKDIDFAEINAKEMKEILSDPNICRFDKVIELVNVEKIEASKKIEELLKDANRNDLVLIYFSGNVGKGIDGDLYLLFKDSEWDYFQSTCLKFDFINDCRVQSKCRLVIVILDCSYGGSAKVSKDMILLASTKSVEYVEEYEEKNKLQPSNFTYYLLEGLRSGNADCNNDGIVSIEELFQYARDKTKASTSIQTPIMIGQLSRDIDIGFNIEKIREREFENYKRKKDKLANELKKDLPLDVFNVSMDFLVKYYERPVELTEIEKKIEKSLEELLEYKIGIKEYIQIVNDYFDNKEIIPEYTIKEDQDYKINYRSLETYQERVAKIFFESCEILQNEQIKINCPKVMKEGKFTNVELQIIKDWSRYLYDKLAKDPTIRISAKVKLIGSSFEIKEVRPEEQSINGDDIDWKWNVKPLKRGSQCLTFTIMIKAEVPNSKTLENCKEELRENIDVRLNYIYFLESYWQWIIGTIIAIIAVILKFKSS
jgi:hypothetical protein